MKSLRLIVASLLCATGLMFGAATIHLKWRDAISPFPRPVAGTETFGIAHHASGDTTLRWRVFMHTDVPRPMAIVVHAGEYKYGNPGPLAICRDLYYQGYNCAVVQYRLANPGLEMHPPRGDQPVGDVGIALEQPNDVALAIKAARLGSTAGTAGLVNGKVACLGGSAGASHCASVAAAVTVSGDKADCAVLMSGIYDFHDPADWITNCGANIFQDIINYGGCNPDTAVGCAGAGGTLDLASPYRNFSATSAPVAVYATNLDTIPVNQYNTFRTDLITAGSTFISRLITETPFDSSGCTRHSFNYWYADPPDRMDSVRTEALAFLQTYCPTP